MIRTAENDVKWLKQGKIIFKLNGNCSNEEINNFLKFLKEELNCEMHWIYGFAGKINVFSLTKDVEKISTFVKSMSTGDLEKYNITKIDLIN